MRTFVIAIRTGTSLTTLAQTAVTVKRTRGTMRRHPVERAAAGFSSDNTTSI
jgi:hypothetical protein